MPKIVHFGEFLKTWSLRSNSVTRQVNFNRTKIGRKCQNWKNSNATFWVIFQHCECNDIYRSFHFAIRSQMSKSVAKDEFVHVRNDFERLAKNEERRHGNENDPQIVFFHLLFSKSSARSLSYQVFDELSPSDSSSIRTPFCCETSLRISFCCETSLRILSRCGGYNLNILMGKVAKYN